MTKRHLSEHEIEILSQFENTALLRDLAHTPGWMTYKNLAQARLDSLKEQHMTTAMDRDSTWASQIRLKGIIEFQKAMEELVDKSPDLLEPEAIRRLVESVNINPDELEGELQG